MRMRRSVVGIALLSLFTSVMIVATPAIADEVVWSLDFDDASHDPWTNNGGSLTYVDDGQGGQALSIERSENWHGIKSPLGVLEPDVTYTFSMRARLPEGTDGNRDVRFVVEPAYDWVANTTINADGWTEITGTYTLPADADPADAAIYLGTSGDSGDTWTLLVDDLTVTAPSGPDEPYEEVDLTFDFEDGFQGWEPRADEQGPPTLELTSDAHGGEQAVLVTDRTSQGDGIIYDFTDVFQTGVTYDITAWVKMGADQGSDDIWLSAQTTSDGTDSFATVEQSGGVPDDEWFELTASYTAPSADRIRLYLETNFNSGGAGDFLVDDITIRSQQPSQIQDLMPIWEFHQNDFPVGVAIDERETVGGPAELTTRHFNQVTAENHMKPDAWYDADRNFQVHPQAAAIMDFAAANDLRVYGHVLVWHSQVPDWFFQDETGEPLTDSDADQQILRDRMRDHIFNVAGALAAWGDYGGNNPLVAWDVVNEVVSDSSEYEDGLRRSEWYRILGDEYIDLAFEYADQAFNQDHAASGTERPVALFINDYNTEQSGKQNRYFDLVQRLVDRGVPIDGVGHQFHLSLATPISSLEATLDRFGEAFDLTQAVTELDVTVGSTVTEAALIEQGYFYRDAFQVFRDHADDLYAVTLWGLTDNRSWRSEQAPLAFDAQLQAKPAYYGIVDAELEPRMRTATVFQGDVPIDDDAVDALAWDTLPLHRFGEIVGFQLRWEPDHLTAYVEVADGTVDDTDWVTFAYDGQTVTIDRDATTDGAVVEETDDGYALVARLPFDPPAEQGDTVQFDLQVQDGEEVIGWNDEGAMGTLTLVEPLSYVEIPEATSTPTIDGEADPIWDEANVVTTEKVIEGDGSAATADVRTLWQDDTLYVLAEVADDQIDISGSDPWIQDSVEIFVDAGNARNGPYRPEDMQLRINVENTLSFGTGDEDEQRARVESATQLVDAGYVVEVAIDLLGAGGPGTFHGLDFQVNDGTDGARTGVRTWADPTGEGYLRTTRWGVGQLVAAEVPCDITVDATHEGRLLALDGLTCVEPGAAIRGGVHVGPGAQLVIDGADIRGGVTALQVDRLEVRDSEVRGGIRSRLARGPIVLSGDDVRGGIQVLFSSTQPDAPVISGNAVHGSLRCIGNDPAPTNDGEPNDVTSRTPRRLRSFDQCAGL